MVAKRLIPGLLSLWLLSGCVKEEYPPALPARLWGNDELVPTTPPPADLAARVSLAPSPFPSEQEWAGLRAYVPPRQVCSGKGKRRRCRMVEPTVVDRANATALVKPQTVHTRDGQSVLVIYPLQLTGFKVYQVITSPGEFTNLILPPGERPMAELTLPPDDWHVLYTKPGTEAAAQLIKVRPRAAGLKGRDMLLTRSGYPIYLEFLSIARAGMLSVTWDMPDFRKEPAPLPLEQRPPKFNDAKAYKGYKIELTSSSKYPPPWMPHGVADDGTNTLITFGTSLEGQKLPSIVELDQKGKPAIVASRLYVPVDPASKMRPVLYIGGLHAAFQLRDSAGLTVKIVRDVPAREEARHAATR